MNLSQFLQQNTQSQDKINELGVRQHENRDQFQPKCLDHSPKVTRQGYTQSSSKEVKQTLLKTCSKPFKSKTSDSATTSQEFQEKKTTKTKQRTPSDKQEKHKNKES